MFQNIRISGYQFIKLSVIGAILFLFFSSLSFAVSELFYETEIIVTATRIPQKLSEQPWSAAVFDKKEMEESGARNVAEVLQSVPGVQIASNGYAGSLATARIRGCSSQHTLVLLDGRRINSPTLGLVDLGSLPLDNVEKIEVVKTPLSAIYGSDAIGGVVNIITKKATRDKQIGFFADYGSHSLSNFGIQSSGQNHYFSAASLYSAGHRANSDYKAENYNTAVFWGDFSLNAIKYNDVKGAPWRITNPILTAREANENYYLNLAYNNQQSGLNLSGYANLLENCYRDPAAFLDTSNRAKTYGFSASKASQGVFGQLVWGADLWKDYSNSSNSGAHTVNHGGAYIQNEFKLAGGSLYVGGRQDLSSNLSSQLNPRIAVIFYPRPDTVLRMSVAQAYRAPTINDLYWNREAFTWAGFTYVTEGNPNLKPEVGRSFDVGIEKMVGGMLLSGTYYYNKVQDMIRWNTIDTAVSSTSTPQNIDDAEINGVEARVEKDLGRGASVFANYTWEDAQNTTAKTLISYSPKNKYNVGIKYSHPALHFLLKQRFVGERFADLANTTKLDGYASTDLTIVRKTGLADIKLQAENIFDVVYQEINGYPSAGRRFSVGVEYKS